MRPASTKKRPPSASGQRGDDTRTCRRPALREHHTGGDLSGHTARRIHEVPRHSRLLPPGDDRRDPHHPHHLPPQRHCRGTQECLRLPLGVGAAGRVAHASTRRPPKCRTAPVPLLFKEGLGVVITFCPPGDAIRRHRSLFPRSSRGFQKQQPPRGASGGTWLVSRVHDELQNPTGT